jgi:hypothetical protein
MASDPIRLAVVVISILSLIVLITKFRIHPFIALILASWFLGIACGLPPTEVQLKSRQLLKCKSALPLPQAPEEQAASLLAGLFACCSAHSGA